MRTRTELLCLASLAIVSACGQSEDEQAMEERADDRGMEQGAVKAVEAVHGGMVLPATSTSKAALEHYRAGWAFVENTRIQAAHNEYLKAVAADPAFAMAHMMAGLTAVSTESFVAHLGHATANKAGATRGEQLVIESWERAFASDAAGRIAALQELAALHPDATRVWVMLGDAYSGVNNSADARDAYKKAIGIDRTYVPAHINFGTSLLSQEPKNFDAAEQHFRHAVALTPNEPNPYDLLGDVHRAQGNLEAAYEDYTRAAELAPDLGSAYQQRGHVNSFLGNYDEARADYTRAAELEDARGSNIGGSFLIYRAYVAVHEGNRAAAIAELRELASNAETAYSEGVKDLQAAAYSNAALFATEDGDEETASALIAAAAAVMREQADGVGTAEFRDAQEATISYMEGLLASRMGDAEGAMTKAADYKTHVASSSNPRKLERMHEIMGMSAYYQGDFAAAVEHLSAGNHLNNMYTKYYLARANEQAGNADEAARLFAELAVWNFNGPGYAMFRKAILEKSAAG